MNFCLVVENEEKELLEYGVLELLYTVEIRSIDHLAAELMKIIEGGHEYFGMWNSVLRVYRACDLQGPDGSDQN